ACHALRWAAPADVSRALLIHVRQCKHPGLQWEVFAYGRLPLACSARCFTARAHNLSKDDCHFRCIDNPDGLRAETQDGKPLLAFNGIRTQSAAVYNLLRAVADFVALGVDVVRVSPQSNSITDVLACFRD